MTSRMGVPCTGGFLLEGGNPWCATLRGVSGRGPLGAHHAGRIR